MILKARVWLLNFMQWIYSSSQITDRITVLIIGVAHLDANEDIMRNVSRCPILLFQNQVNILMDR